MKKLVIICNILFACALVSGQKTITLDGITIPVEKFLDGRWVKVSDLPGASEKLWVSYPKSNCYFTSSANGQFYGMMVCLGCAADTVLGESRHPSVIKVFNHEGRMLWKLHSPREFTAVEIAENGEHVYINWDDQWGELGQCMYIYDRSGSAIDSIKRVTGFFPFRHGNGVMYQYRHHNNGSPAGFSVGMKDYETHENWVKTYEGKIGGILKVAKESGHSIIRACNPDLSSDTVFSFAPGGKLLWFRDHPASFQDITDNGEYVLVVKYEDHAEILANTTGSVLRNIAPIHTDDILVSPYEGKFVKGAQMVGFWDTSPSLKSVFTFIDFSGKVVHSVRMDQVRKRFYAFSVVKPGTIGIFYDHQKTSDYEFNY